MGEWPSELSFHSQYYNHKRTDWLRVVRSRRAGEILPISARFITVDTSCVSNMKKGKESAAVFDS